MVSQLPGEVDFLATCREACVSESCASIAGGLALVSINDPELALVGPSLAEVHSELPQ